MLIFRRELPRSLAWTAEETVALLGEFGARSGRQGPADRLARAAPVDSSRSSTSTRSSSRGLHEWLHAYIRDNNAIGAGDRRPVPVRLMQLSRPARHHLHLCASPPAASSSCCARRRSSFAGQNVLDWRIDVDCDARLREGRDGYGNVTHMLYVDKPVSQPRRSRSTAGC